MTPKISTYLLKVTEFCNLNCPYCYMFNLRDFAYKAKPKFMPLEIVEAFAPKAVALAQSQGVRRLTVSLHGGEPLLAGREWFRSAIRILRQAGGDTVKFSFITQTNGVLLDEEWLEFLEEQNVTLGISMDGPRHIHDKTRINFAGRGSYDEVARGVTLASRRPKIFGGVLCVMDPTTDGLEVYHHFRELGVEKIDFLWPLDHNWNAPPPSLMTEDATPYADYLIPIFDEWWQEGNGAIKIRYFTQLIKNIFGARRGGVDALGGNPVSIISIDSDGGIEPVDSLKACGDGFTEMGLNILKDPLEAVYDQPLFQAAISGQDGLCEKCKACPLHDICGGGYLPNRYSNINGFTNPTVYCRDLWKLTTHILGAANDTAQVKRFFPQQAAPPVEKSAAL
jgi:uncharacterized protein